MKNTLKITISTILAITILALTNIPSVAATSIAVKINNKILTFDAKPRTVNGRTLVPVAILAKELGATVEWIADTKSVIITLQTKENIKTIYLKVGKASALVNGMEVELDCKPVIFEGRTFVPLRFISENFGATVIWNGKTKIVSITYTVPVQEKPPILIPPWEITTSPSITIIK